MKAQCGFSDRIIKIVNDVKTPKKPVARHSLKYDKNNDILYAALPEKSEISDNSKLQQKSLFGKQEPKSDEDIKLFSQETQKVPFKSNAKLAAKRNSALLIVPDRIIESEKFPLEIPSYNNITERSTGEELQKENEHPHEILCLPKKHSEALSSSSLPCVDIDQKNSLTPLKICESSDSKSECGEIPIENPNNTSHISVPNSDKFIIHTKRSIGSETNVLKGILVPFRHRSQLNVVQ